MNIEQYRDHCLNKPGVTESFPFSKLSDTLIFKVGGKIFTATNIITFASFSVKYYPESIEELRAEHPCVQNPAYFSKRHWNNILIDGSEPDQLLLTWLDISYELVIGGLPKKVQQELLGGNESETEI